MKTSLRALSAFSVSSLLLLTPLTSPFGSTASAAGSEWPHYQAGAPLKGELRSVGSDTMGGLMDLWIEGFHNHQPGVTVFHANRGSASAPAALLDGSANLGPMARTMKSSEVESFRARLGVEPTQVRVALSGIAIYVSKNNPIRSLSFEKLDAIFSEERKRGGSAVATWGELGVTGPFASTPIMPIGRIDTSYAHGFFKQQVLVQGAYRTGIQATSDTASMIDTIAANPGAIGFGEVEAAGDSVRVLPIARTNESEPVLPKRENLLSEAYPLSRYLNLYVVQMPNRELDAVTKNFLTYVLSQEGQTFVKREGLLPLPAAVAQEELAKLAVER